MHAKDLIYMAYFDPHQVFDGLTSYIHSMRQHTLTMCTKVELMYRDFVILVGSAQAQSVIQF